MKDKKAQLGTLEGLIIGLVTIAMVLVIGFLIMAQAKTQAATLDNSGVCDDGNDSYACNGTVAVTNAIQDIPAWLPIIVVVVVGSMLIGLVSLLRKGG